MMIHVLLTAGFVLGFVAVGVSVVRGSHDATCEQLTIADVDPDAEWDVWKEGYYAGVREALARGSDYRIARDAALDSSST